MFLGQLKFPNMAIIIRCPIHINEIVHGTNVAILFSLFLCLLLWIPYERQVGYRYSHHLAFSDFILFQFTSHPIPNPIIIVNIIDTPNYNC